MTGQCLDLLNVLRESERQFETKVNDFFRYVLPSFLTSFYLNITRDATCAGYGQQMFDQYQLKKQRKEPLTSEVVFLKLDPTSESVGVVKTRTEGETVERVGSELLGAAKDVIATAEEGTKR